ncbi:MAG: DUF4347 domain-containing protein, partial [Phyllobacteriaceae bacterium]|nr:DUF4347 domain-containing protein [Phyllobacteriaceae bacterium]
MRQAARRPALRGAGERIDSKAGDVVLLGGDGGLLLRALEPRILLDAAVAETGFELADHMADEDAAQRFPADDWAQSGHVLDFGAATGNGGYPAAAGDGEAASVQIVFIDGSLEDLDTIMAGIGPGYEAVFLSGDEDGVEQIARYLADRNDIDAIHILAHGRAGTLELGNTRLTAASIGSRHADEMAVIRDALSPDADILIYGCNFAAGTRGQTAVAALMEASGADVSASDDLTGAAALGGDWDLEVSEGEIE